MSRRRTSRRRKDQRGFVVVWMSVVVVLLIAVAALAVDLVHAYAEGQHLQNAVDAASLAGAIEIPASTGGSTAQDQVKSVLNAHYGNDDAGNNVTITQNDVDLNLHPGTGFSNQMDVTATKKVDTFFAKAIGFGSVTVKRSAQAQYDAPVQMGSPANYMGVVPECPGGSTPGNCENTTPFSGITNQGVFPSIGGSNLDKARGNAISAVNCVFAQTDGCNPAGSGGANVDYNANGEDFLIHNDTPGLLTVYLYDPSFVKTGFDCGEVMSAPDYPGSVSANYNVPPTQQPNEWCAGDYEPIGGGPAMSTTYSLYDPANMATPLCTHTYGGFTTNTVPGKDGIDSAYATDPSNTSVYFHAWAPFCALSSAHVTPDGQEYVLRVTSSAGTQINDFSILATHGGISYTNRLGVFARKMLPMTTRAKGAGGHQFYLARVLPSSQDRTLTVNFFDMGDSSQGLRYGTFDIQLYNATGTPVCKSLPLPAAGSVGGSTPIMPYGTPYLDSQLTVSGCTSVHYDADTTGCPSHCTNENGRWITMKITLPKQGSPGGYTCDLSAAVTTPYQNCWVSIIITPHSNPGPTDGWINDITTWNAYLDTSPARLVG